MARCPTPPIRTATAIRSPDIRAPNGRQFVADGMKIDLERATVTVTDDPKHPEFRAVTWTVNEY